MHRSGDKIYIYHFPASDGGSVCADHRITHADSGKSHEHGVMDFSDSPAPAEGFSGQGCPGPPGPPSADAEMLRCGDYGQDKGDFCRQRGEAGVSGFMTTARKKGSGLP